MKLALLVAVAENGVIGQKGSLPWRVSADLKAFRELTLGKPVIMGRKTFESLPKALDNRDMIVLSREPGFAPAGALAASSLAGALALAAASAARLGSQEACVIGGADLYRLTLPFADRLYLTRIHASPDGDTFFPPLDLSGWRLLSSAPLPRSPKDTAAATAFVYERSVASFPRGT